jgi:hypothetical protein
VPELSLEEFVFSASDEAVMAAETPARRRAPIPGPTEFEISLKAYVDKIAATCPSSGHREVQGDREEGENPSNLRSLSCSVTFSNRPDQIFKGSFSTFDECHIRCQKCKRTRESICPGDYCECECSKSSVIEHNMTSSLSTSFGFI